jgi:hypothetical protein
MIASRRMAMDTMKTQDMKPDPPVRLLPTSMTTFTCVS